MCDRIPYMPYKNKEDRLNYQKEYKKTDAYKKSMQKFKETYDRKAYMYRYNRSEKSIAYRKKYNAKNSERFRMERKDRRDKTYKGMGGKCIECGFSDYRALQIDHINGDGKKERHLRSRNDYYPNVLKSFLSGEKRYQLLCCNCNWIKREENGEYRKKGEENGQIPH